MGNFGAGLAQGLGTGLKEAVERRDRKEYQDALIMQAKAHAQLFEAQHILAKQKGAAQEQLGEILKTIPGFGGQGATAQPQPGVAQPSTPQAGGQSGVGAPQLGPQPSTGQMPMLTPQQAFAFDALAKQAYDVNTDMLKRAMSRGDYSHKIDTGTHTIVFDKSNRQIGSPIPHAVEYDYQTTQTPEGATVTVPIPKKWPIVGGAQPYQGPSPLIKEQSPGTVPPGKLGEEADKKLRDLEGSLNSIRKLREYTTDPKDAQLFGWWASKKHDMWQDPDSLISATGRSIVGPTMGGPSPRLTQFRAALETLNSKIRYDLYAGNLTPQEAIRYQKQAAAATTQNQLAAVLDMIESEYSNKVKSLKTQAVTPMNTRAGKSASNLEQELLNRGYKKDAQGKWIKP